MIKILSKKLFGNKGEKIIRSILVSTIIYGGLSQLDYNIKAEHLVIMFMVVFFSGSVTVQFLSSNDNAKYLKGFFSMPFDRKKAIAEYATSCGMYVLFTKTLPIYALVAAFARITPVDLAVSFPAFLFSCFGAFTGFALFRKSKILSFLIIASGIAMILFLPKSIISVIVFSAAALILFVIMIHLDPYDFISVSSGKKGKKAKRSSGRVLVAKYIIRYISSNRSYLVSPLVLTAFLCYMAKMMNDMGFKRGIYICLALLTVNAPLSIIVSYSRGFNSKLNSLPNNLKSFYIPYALTLFSFYILSGALFMIIMHFLGTTFTLRMVIVSVLFAAQAAASIVYMENKHTITKWSVETDLWHHPRKYIVPAVLVLEAGIISIL